MRGSSLSLLVDPSDTILSRLREETQFEELYPPRILRVEGNESESG